MGFAHPEAMVKMDLTPGGMEPLDGPELPAAQVTNETEGFVYGHAVKQPRSRPPDIEGMFKAAGIPGPKDGGLPHTLEWYRGAAARSAKRMQERDELLKVKNASRMDWASIVTSRIEEKAEQVDLALKEPPPIALLAELLARTAHERPKAVERIEELKMRVSNAQEEAENFNQEMVEVREALRKVQEDVVRSRREGDRAEEERIRSERAERLRKARAEKALRRNEAAIRGEEFKESDSDGGDEDVPEDAAAIPPEISSARDKLNIFGSGQPPTPGAVRGGLARELPPIIDPPPVPPLDD